MKVGDWVTVDLMDYKVSGYIVMIKKEDGLLRIHRFSRKYKNGYIEYPKPNLATYGISQCEIDPINVSGCDPAACIDAALSTRDQEWFDCLTRKNRLGEWRHEKARKRNQAAV